MQLNSDEATQSNSLKFIQTISSLADVSINNTEMNDKIASYDYSALLSERD